MNCFLDPSSNIVLGVSASGYRVIPIIDGNGSSWIGIVLNTNVDQTAVTNVQLDFTVFYLSLQ